MANEQKQNGVTITLTGAVLALLQEVTRQGEQRGESFSLEYRAEDCLVAGLKAQKRSWKHTDETKRARAFSEALSAHPEYAQDPAKMAQLMQKYRIGATVRQ